MDSLLRAPSADAVLRSATAVLLATCAAAAVLSPVQAPQRAAQHKSGYTSTRESSSVAPQIRMGSVGCVCICVR